MPKPYKSNANISSNSTTLAPQTRIEIVSSLAPAPESTLSLTTQETSLLAASSSETSVLSKSVSSSSSNSSSKRKKKSTSLTRNTHPEEAYFALYTLTSNGKESAQLLAIYNQKVKKYLPLALYNIFTQEDEGLFVNIHDFFGCFMATWDFKYLEPLRVAVGPEWYSKIVRNKTTKQSNGQESTKRRKLLGEVERYQERPEYYLSNSGLYLNGLLEVQEEIKKKLVELEQTQTSPTKKNTQNIFILKALLSLIDAYNVYQQNSLDAANSHKRRKVTSQELSAPAHPKPLPVSRTSIVTTDTSFSIVKSPFIIFTFMDGGRERPYFLTLAEPSMTMGIYFHNQQESLFVRLSECFDKTFNRDETLKTIEEFSNQIKKTFVMRHNEEFYISLDALEQLIILEKSNPIKLRLSSLKEAYVAFKEQLLSPQAEPLPTPVLVDAAPISHSQSSLVNTSVDAAPSLSSQPSSLTFSLSLHAPSLSSANYQKRMAVLFFAATMSDEPALPVTPKKRRTPRELRVFPFMTLYTETTDNVEQAKLLELGDSKYALYYVSNDNDVEKNLYINTEDFFSFTSRPQNRNIDYLRKILNPDVFNNIVINQLNKLFSYLVLKPSDKELEKRKNLLGHIKKYEKEHSKAYLSLKNLLRIEDKLTTALEDSHRSAGSEIYKRLFDLIKAYKEQFPAAAKATSSFTPLTNAQVRPRKPASRPEPDEGLEPLPAPTLELGNAFSSVGHNRYSFSNSSSSAAAAAEAAVQTSLASQI